MFHELGRALDSGSEIDLLHLDFAKDFDSVCYSKLLCELKYLGISGQLPVNCFNGYLHDGKQPVVIEGVSSSFVNVKSGLPPGSVIGPQLFILCVNDLPELTKNTTVAVQFLLITVNVIVQFMISHQLIEISHSLIFPLCTTSRSLGN